MAAVETETEEDSKRKTLSKFVQFWIKKLTNIDSKSKLKRFEAFSEGSWIVFISNSILALLGIARGFEIMFTRSFLDSTSLFCLLNGMASCFVGEWVFIHQRKSLTEAFNELLYVAQALEAESDEEMKEYSSMVARRAERWYLFETTHTAVSMCGVVFPPLLIGQLQLELFGLQPRTELELYAVIFVQLIVVSPFAYAAYKFFSMILNANMCCAALYHMVGDRIRRARGEREFLSTAAVHSRLDAAATKVDATFNAYSAAYFVPVLVAAGLSTYNVLSGRMDFYCLVPGQLILFIFIPICQTGQALQDNSSHRLVFSAYSGSWVEEDVRARAVCLTVMKRAAKATRVSARGIGSLNMPVCQASLKVWFRYTQLLFNLK